MLFTPEEVQAFVTERIFKDSEVLRLFTLECVEESARRAAFNCDMHANVLHAYMDEFMEYSTGIKPTLPTIAQASILMIVNIMVDKIYAMMVEELTEKANKENPQ